MGQYYFHFGRRFQPGDVVLNPKPMDLMMNVRLACDDFGAGQTHIREMICALAVRSTEQVSH